MTIKEQLYGIFVIIILLIFLSKHRVYEYFTSNFTVSDYDKRIWKVAGGFDDGNMAANKLAELHEFIINFLRYVKKKYISGNMINGFHNNFFGRILKNYNPDNIFENNPRQGEETSFVSNKGAEFGICLRQKGEYQNKIHEMSILKFVMLHELTHLGCISYGHDSEFWGSFKIVLHEAVESGLYIPVDYRHTPTNYCGLDVTSNPHCDGINKC